METENRNQETVYTLNTIVSFTQLRVWRVARALVARIYKITASLPANEKYGLISQLQRAAVSVSCNISEGYCRYHYRDKVKFYYQARGSIGEVQNILFLLIDLNLYPEFELQQSINDYEKLSHSLNALIKANMKQTKADF